MSYKLENWSVCSTGDMYTPPELRRPVLQGQVYGHPNFEDGAPLTSSYIVKMEGELVVTRSGSKYELGTVDPEWEKAFPNAAERFKSSFDENGNMKTKP